MTTSKRNPKPARVYRDAYLSAMLAGAIAPVQPASLSNTEARKIRATVRQLVRAS